MKKVKLLLTMALVIVATMICGTMSAFALTEGDWEFQLLDSEAMITGYTGEKGDIVIPHTLHGVKVTSMDCDWNVFKGATSITFPGTMKKIETRAIYGWRELEALVFGEGVESISGCSIQHFENLSSVSLPSTLKTIGGHIFNNTPSLKEISIPASVKEIGWMAFNNSGLEKVDLSSLTQLKLENSNFSNCPNLEEIILPPDLKEISLAFAQNCSKLEKIEIPASVTSIGPKAFEGTSLKEIILPSGLKELHPSTFRSTQLKEVVIPYGVTYLGYGGGSIYGVFADCKNLEAVYVPDTVTSMGGAIISGCPNAIIYCSEGSFAEKQCKTHKISYLTDNSVNSGIHVYYNGKRISFHSYSQNPEILEGRTLVPLRSIFEAMGASVDWDGNTSTAIAKRGNVEVKITIGANEIYKNGKAIGVDVPAQIMNSRTMVPARVIAETFGADVQWNGNGKSVLITE